MRGAADALHVDAIEQHRELSRVHLDSAAVAGDTGRLKSALLEALIIQHQAASVPEQDLAAVAPTPQENKQVTREQIHSPLAANDAAQPIVASAQIDRVQRQVNPHTGRQRQQARNLETSAATKPGSQASVTRNRTPGATSISTNGRSAPTTRTGRIAVDARPAPAFCRWYFNAATVTPCRPATSLQTAPGAFASATTRNQNSELRDDLAIARESPVPSRPQLGRQSPYGYGVAPDGSRKMTPDGKVVVPPKSTAFKSDADLVRAEQQLRENALPRELAKDPNQTVIRIEKEPLGFPAGDGYSRIGPAKQTPGVVQEGPLQRIEDIFFGHRRMGKESRYRRVGPNYHLSRRMTTSHAFPSIRRALALFADLEWPVADRLLHRMATEADKATAMRQELDLAVDDPSTDWAALVSNDSYELTDADDPEAKGLVLSLLWDALHPNEPPNNLTLANYRAYALDTQNPSVAFSSYDFYAGADVDVQIEDIRTNEALARVKRIKRIGNVLHSVYEPMRELPLPSTLRKIVRAALRELLSGTTAIGGADQIELEDARNRTKSVMAL
ncbi:MAG: hypothetical protein QM756_45765 [Polyangiaceae bacterium]